MHMSSSSAPSTTYGILAAMAADPHWSQASSTRGNGPELPDRRTTRTDTGSPYNLAVYDAARTHEQAVAALVERHRAAGPGPVRMNVYEAAAEIAARSDKAAADFAVVEAEGYLMARILAGDGIAAIAAVSCPACACWGLIPVRIPAAGWGARCSNVRYCTGSSPTLSPRTWTLHDVAEHQVRIRPAA